MIKLCQITHTVNGATVSLSYNDELLQNYDITFSSFPDDSIIAIQATHELWMFLDRDWRAARKFTTTVVNWLKNKIVIFPVNLSPITINDILQDPNPPSLDHLEELQIQGLLKQALQELSKQRIVYIVRPANHAGIAGVRVTGQLREWFIPWTTEQI